ncbi:MAG: FAD-dependent oxidoreductase [Thaumarchaeota archaeon]|jgi:thioredoxin reductase (NADPH)|nr:FAD-dependent oxidoreductase [Candidatus Geocrenenecus arthurdayi]
MRYVDYDIIIVGGGIAGLTAALYASRQKMSTLIITKDVGGQMTLSSSIENYPGYKSISGYELASKILDQVQQYGVEILFDEVVKIDERDDQVFIIKTRGGYELSCEAVILAFGKTPREMNVPGEEKFKGRGVSYCAVCDAPLYRGKTVLVYGWGPQAFEAVNLLCEYDNKVYLVHRGKSRIDLGSLPAKCIERFEELPETIVKEVRGGDKLESVVLESLADRTIKELKVDGIFVELGYEMKTDWIKGFVELNENGEIIIDSYCATSRRGVFASGDVTNIAYKQAVISAAQGAIAALSAYNYIQEKRGGLKIKSDWREVLKE